MTHDMKDCLCLGSPSDLHWSGDEEDQKKERRLNSRSCGWFCVTEKAVQKCVMSGE